MGVPVEVQRKVEAVLFIAMVAGADMRVHQGTSLGYGYASAEQVEGSISFPEPAKEITKQMDALLADQGVLHQAKRVAEQMEKFVTLPSLQKLMNTFGEQLKARPEMNFGEQADLFAQNMETLQADPNFQMQSRRITEQMHAIIADPEFQTQGNRAAKSLEAVLVDPSLQEQSFRESTDNDVDAMFDNILARSLDTSAVQQTGLDAATSGKSANLATQPRTGMQASMVPSTRAASQAPYGVSTRSAVRAKALFGLGQKKEAPPKGKLSASKKQAKAGRPQPKAENAEDPDEVQDFVNDAALLFARLAAASFMIHHGQEKLASAELFTKFAIDKYFTFLPAIGGSRVFWTYSAASVQAVAPFFLASGVFSRVAGAALTGTMLGAFYYSLASTGLEGFPLSKMASQVPVFHNYNFETPFLYISVFALVAANGPGKLSVSQALGWNDDNTILGKIKQ